MCHLFDWDISGFNLTCGVLSVVRLFWDKLRLKIRESLARLVPTACTIQFRAVAALHIAPTS